MYSKSYLNFMSVVLFAFFCRDFSCNRKDKQNIKMGCSSIVETTKMFIPFSVINLIVLH